MWILIYSERSDHYCRLIVNSNILFFYARSDRINFVLVNKCFMLCHDFEYELKKNSFGLYRILSAKNVTKEIFFI